VAWVCTGEPWVEGDFTDFTILSIFL
jgi:hypothetical protein